VARLVGTPKGPAHSFGWAHVTVAGVRVAGRVRRLLPDAVAGPALRLAADAGWLALRGRRRAVERNLVRLAGDCSPRERARLARATFHNFARCQADVLMLPGASATSLLGLVEASGLADFTRIVRRGRGAIVVTAHLGNPELAAAGLALLGVPAYAFVEAIHPARDALFATFRTATGLRLIPSVPGAAAAALDALRDGGIVAIVGDRALGSARRINVPFGAGRRPLPTWPAWLALRSGAPLFTGHTVLSDGTARRYRGIIEGEVPVDDLGKDPLAALTTRIAARLSAAVEHHPDQWFVFRPEWEGDALEKSR
jgi:lauroyl/myristoyl acyltransferase